MGRRASEGSALSEYEPPDYSSVNLVDPDEINMKAMYKSNYLPEGADMAGLNYSNPTGYRLMEVGRRESTSSLSSSIADGSKDSLVSYDSASTLTGHDTDDSAIMTRFRKSVKQKEEFLKMPTSNVEPVLIRREYHNKPKKLDPVWPPNEREWPARATKPIHQNFQRVKNDIDIERDLSTQNGQNIGGGTAAYSLPQQRFAISPKDTTYIDQSKIHEAETAPEGYNSLEIINGTILEENIYDDRRYKFQYIFSFKNHVNLYLRYPPGPQLVQKRAKEFESGRPLPEDDPVLSNRMKFSRSELARISSKKLVPNVCERAQEYETRVEPRRDPSGTSTTSDQSQNKKIQRDSRSLDSSGTYNIYLTYLY